MKKNIFILLVGLLSCQLTVFAQNPSGKTIDVEIKSDTTIVVRDLFGEGCKLYGDNIYLASDKSKQVTKIDGSTENRSYSKYGGDDENYFNKRMKKANEDKEEFKKYVSRNENGLVIELRYEEIPDTVLKLSFYGALYDGIYKQKADKPNENYVLEWYGDSNTIYCVSITKGEKAVNPEPNPVHPTPTPEPNPDLMNEILKFIEPIFILLIICLFIVGLCTLYRLKKRVDSFLNNQKQSSPKAEINIDKIKQTVISKIKSEELAQRISNEDIHSVVDRSDIQLYIQTVIAGKVDEYLRNNKIANPIPTDINSGYNQQSPVVQPELRTTNVEYRADNNCFMVSENPEYRIFEVYSANGKYYYTIINDSAIRRNLLSIIAAFSKCIDHRLDSPIPTTVEVIKDGQLIKNGDVYLVDTNCILQVSLM